MEKTSRYMLLSDSEKLEIIIVAAKKLLETTKLVDLLMKDVIVASGLKRSTFLNFIPNKETLISHLAIDAVEGLLNIIRRIREIEGSSRLKLLSLYVGYLIYTSSKPELFPLIIQANSPINQQTTSRELNLKLENKNNEIITLIQWTIEQGILKQEIKMLNRISTFDLAFYLWTGLIGVVTYTNSEQHNIIDAMAKYKYYVRQMLDLLPWRPTSNEFDYEVEVTRITQIYFKEEFTKIEKNSIKF